MGDVKRAPKGLNAAGRRLWKSVSEPYNLEPAELAVLELAARQADTIAALEEVLDRDGVIVVGSTGQARLNGAIAELRQSRLALGRLIGMLGLPDELDRPMSEASRRASRAASARWSRKDALAARQVAALERTRGGSAAG